jgi:hypothetical protein
MVNRSIKKSTNEIVYADKVDRSEASTVASRGEEWLCFECMQPTIHKHGTVKGPHFAHKAGTPDSCPHKSSPCDWYDKSNDTIVSSSAFYRNWVSNQRLFKSPENGKVYTMGSNKSYIVVMDYIHSKIRDNLTITKDIPQEIYILNGKTRNVRVYKADDKYVMWVRFGRKCEVGYLLQYKKWVAIDIGNHFLYLIKSDEKLPDSEYDLTNEINDFYKMELIDIGSFVRNYLPDDYVLTGTRENKPIECHKLINNKEEQERRRRIREENEKIRIEKERIEKIKNDEFERLEKLAIENEIVISNNVLLPYIPRTIKNKYEIKKLYEEYIKYLNESPETVINFAWNTTKQDEIEYIDICGGIIPDSEKCSFQKGYLIKTIEGLLNQ